MTQFWAVVLGIVQGLTEFLPISSSGHLVLVPWLFGLDKIPSLLFLSSTQFDIALHAGSAIAILVALWGDWVKLVKDAIAGETFARKFIGFLLLTSIPGALFGVLFEDQVKTLFRAPLSVAIQLMVFGVLLWAVDKYMRLQEPLETMNWWKATLVGVAQALALMPGVSRSGATITTGRALGFSREAAAKYSFMAALPIIAGAAVFGLKDVPMGTLFSLDWVLGFAAALISSLVAMRWLLRFLRTHSFALFMYYRLALGALVIAVVVLRG